MTSADVVIIRVVIVLDSHGIDVTLLRNIALSPPAVVNYGLYTRPLRFCGFHGQQRK